VPPAGLDHGLLGTGWRLEERVRCRRPTSRRSPPGNAAAEPGVEIRSAGPRPDAGLTGPAVVDLAAMRDAMDDIALTPARSTRWSTSTLVSDHSVQVDRRATPRLRVQLPSALRAQTASALVPQWGQGVSTTSASCAPHRIRPPVHLEYLPSSSTAARTPAPPGLPGHPGRPPLAHDDVNGPRRPRLGRRPDRGRGGDAVSSRARCCCAGLCFKALRLAARWRDGTPGPAVPRCCASGRRSKVVRVSTGPACRPSPPDRATLGNMSRIRLDLRDLPGRCPNAPLPD